MNDTVTHDSRDSHDPYDLLVDVLAEHIAGELDYEVLDALSDDDLRRIAEAAIEPVLQVERETGRSVEALLEDEPALREALEAFEREEFWSGAEPGGYEIPDGPDEDQGGA